MANLAGAAPAAAIDPIPEVLGILADRGDKNPGHRRGAALAWRDPRPATRRRRGAGRAGRQDRAGAHEPGQPTHAASSLFLSGVARAPRRAISDDDTHAATSNLAVPHFAKLRSSSDPTSCELHSA